MGKMTKRPTHPGNIPLSIKIQDLAEILGISRKTLSKIINERGSVTPEMALRLSRAFDTPPDFWLNLQKNFDLWVAEQTSTEWQKAKPFPKHILRGPSATCSAPAGPIYRRALLAAVTADERYCQRVSGRPGRLGQILTLVLITVYWPFLVEIACLPC